MIIKNITLKNFRQFKGEKPLEFSIDKKQNVNLILGDNGTGKTTFSQAFTWCLYGKTNFNDPFLLNKEIANNLKKNEEAEVSVKLEINHNNIDYLIIRTAKHNKKNDSLTKGLIDLSVSIKNNGNLTPLQNPKETINKILPQELSQFFFFDGERIGKLSVELTEGKTTEFYDSVKTLLGLDAFTEALKHLKPTGTTSVWGKLNKKLVGVDNRELGEISKKIQFLNKSIEETKNSLKVNGNETEEYEKEKERLTKILEKSADGKEFVERRKLLEKDNKNIELEKENIFNSIMKIIDRDSMSFFARPLISKIIQRINKEKDIDFGVPDIHCNTIDYLIKRGKCICGAELIQGSSNFKELIKLKEYLPPQSISFSIKDFINKSQNILDSEEHFYKNLNDEIVESREKSNIINRNNSEIEKINENLKKMGDIKQVEEDYERINKKLISLKENLNIYNQQLGAFNNELKGFTKKQRELSEKQKDTNKVQKVMDFAKEAFKRLEYIYANEEENMRKGLELTINENFSEIYGKGLEIVLNENKKIEIKIIDKNFNNTNVETSQGQNISMIFAYIVAIIKMVKEIRKTDLGDIEIGEAHPYPLIMDATLSFYDKKRINNVCNKIPEVAEQIILFIKDTDGEIAKQHMNNRIGKEYYFEKINELETKIKEV